MIDMHAEAFFPKDLTDRQIARRQSIVSAADSLLLEKGYEGASMKAVARLANVTEKTLYNIYGSKADLFGQVFRLRTRQTYEAARSEAPKGGLKFLEALVAQIARSSLELPDAAKQGIQFALARPDFMFEDEEAQNLVNRAFAELVADIKGTEFNEISGSIWRFRAGILSGLIFWSNGMLANEELRSYLELQLHETLITILPPARAARHLRRSKTCLAELGIRHENRASAGA